MRSARTAMLVALLLIGGTAPAWAQKTDVITLGNGDRITGEIKELNRGRLELSTDDAGTIDIEWDKITAVVATRVFEVETSDGRRLLGSFEPASSRMLTLVGSDGRVSLTMQETTHITPIGARFWSRLDGSVDLGFSYTRSSGITQTTLNSNVLFRKPAYLIRLSVSGTATHLADEDDTDDRGTGALSYVRYRGRWFISGIGTFETNESLGLILRSQGAGLFGQRLVNTNSAMLEFGGGLVVNNEEGLDTEPTQNFEGVVSLRASYYRYDRPKTTIDLSVQHYPSLSTWGRHRLQLDSSVRRELLKDLMASVNVYDTFDSAPPNPDAAENDVGVTLSLGWTF